MGESALPLVSVLMTSFNASAFLAEAIRSVFAQTYAHLELIVVDDGSTDSSWKIIQDLCSTARCPMRIISKPNGGQASALNCAFRSAQGDVIALIDGDDVWYSEKISEMIKMLHRHPNGGVYQHQVDNGSGRPFRPILISGDVFSAWKEVGAVNFLIWPELVKVNIPTTGLMFRREVLEAILPIPEELVVCPDFYLFVLGCSCGALYSHPTTYALWRNHEGNAGRESRFSFREYWLPVVIPTVNKALRARGHAVRFEFCRHAVFWEPFRLIAGAIARRSRPDAFQ